MEWYTMFLDWKNQYCQNDYTTQSYPWIQSNHYQITNSIFHRIRTKSLQFVWKHKKLQVAKAILRSWERKKPELEERGFWTPEYTTKPHQYNNSTSTATEIQIHGTGYKAQRYTATATQSMTKEARTYSRERTISSITGAGKTEQLHVKEWN